MTEDEKQMGLIRQFIQKTGTFFSKQPPVHPNMLQIKSLIADAQLGIIVKTLVKAGLITESEVTEELKKVLHGMEENLLSGQAKEMPNPDDKLTSIFRD